MLYMFFWGHIDYLFEILNLLAVFLSHLLLCFILPCLGENPAFGWVELKIILFFLILEFWNFFPDKSYISGPREWQTFYVHSKEIDK